MLTKLIIQNYALIDHVNISFTNGLTTITGETGAGKSILLGGLGLILGNRAESNVLLDPTKKCVIEGVFNLSKYHLQNFFKQHDIDYEEETLVRRELLPGGKSRAFINDSPVKLEVLSELQSLLIDVHSQHQTLQLNEQSYQFEVIDSLAGTIDMVSRFKQIKKNYESKISEYVLFKEKISKEKEHEAYHKHLHQELTLADLKIGELETLEAEEQRLSHIELIRHSLLQSHELLQEEQIGLLDRLYQIKESFLLIKTYTKTYQELYDRVESSYIDLKDLSHEVSNLVENEDFAETSIESIQKRIQLIYNLFQKHQVKNETDLLAVYEELSKKVNEVTHSDQLLKKQQEAIDSLSIELTDLGEIIHQKRAIILNNFEKEIIKILQLLGMPEVVFKVQLTKVALFNAYGTDTIQWLFSSNKGKSPGLLKQVASGGELSRIMLAIKSIVAKKAQLPTIIFDEIDTGISGEVSIKMSEIMKQMSQTMQVICITHLPQIAAKGEQHFKVFKETTLQKTETQIKLLNEQERLLEIAEMLGGKNISETATKHAAELLK